MLGYQLNTVLRIQQFPNFTMSDSDIDKFYERSAFGGPWTHSTMQEIDRWAERDRLRRHTDMDATEINSPGQSVAQ